MLVCVVASSLEPEEEQEEEEEGRMALSSTLSARSLLSLFLLTVRPSARAQNPLRNTERYNTEERAKEKRGGRRGGGC